MESSYYPESSGSANNFNEFETSIGTDDYPNHMEADFNSAAPVAIGFGFILFGLLLGIALYVYYALAFQKMARKLSIPDDWFAWVPVLNIILLLRIANRPFWWLFLMFIPILNIVIQVVVWMDVAKAMRKPEWWGVLIIIPFVNLIVPGYLAFADGDVVFEGPDGGEMQPDIKTQNYIEPVQASVENTEEGELIGTEGQSVSNPGKEKGVESVDDNKDLPKV